MLNHRVKGWDKNYDLNIPTPVNVKNSVGTNKLSGVQFPKLVNVHSSVGTK
jgi:hypothetical protein